MDDFRSSQQQLKDELDAIYRRMTDPDEQSRAARNERRKKEISRMTEDYGL